MTTTRSKFSVTHRMKLYKAQSRFQQTEEAAATCGRERADQQRGHKMIPYDDNNSTVLLIDYSHTSV